MLFFAAKARLFIIGLIGLLLLAMPLTHGSPLFADGGPLSSSFLRIGLHSGSLTLPAVTLRYGGQVRFFMADFLDNTSGIMVDDAGSWRLEREAIRLQVGPFATLAEAQNTLSRWPASLQPSFVLQESAGFLAVGGLFFTAEQALLALPALQQAGLAGASVRGAMFLVTDLVFPSREEAELQRASLTASGIWTTVFFDGTFRLAAGRELDAAGLSRLRTQLAALTPLLTWSDAPTDFRRIEVIRQDGRHLFVFANLPRRVLRAEIVQGADIAMSIEGRLHRGSFEFAVNSAHHFMVIGIMDVDDYLKGVVPREMPALWPLEALKAQAVVARTYAYANLNRHGADGFDLCTLSTCCQAYGGVAWEHEASSRAVDETRGVIALYNGRPAATFYHSDSGGHTEGVENVWGGAPQSFLVGVPDPFPAAAGSTHTNWRIEISQQTLQNIVRHNRGDVGTVLAVQVARRHQSGRVAELVISGTRGAVTYTRQQARLFDGSAGLFALRSTMYNVTATHPQAFLHNGQSVSGPSSLQNVHVATAAGRQVLPIRENYIIQGAAGTRSITAVPTSFVFRGSGWGHGVGMSQWGARGMAMAGATFRDILLHYYPGVDLITLAY